MKRVRQLTGPVARDITSGLSPVERGQRLHQVLARFVKEFKGVLTAQGRWDDAEAQRLLMSAARDLLAPLLSDPYWQADWERWFGNGLTPGLLFAWLDLEKARFEAGWRWGDAEVDFAGLAQPDWPFSLKGGLHRYDCNPDLGELIVWDYKTGELPKERRVFELKEEFQLPGYLLAVRQGLIPKVGTLLWLILDAAGEKNIGDSIRLENNQGTVLTAETLPQVLLASQFNVIVRSKYTLTFDPDQTLSLFESDALLDKGRWWMEGDHYCHDLGAGYGGRQCFQVLQNENRITLFDLNGYAALQLQAVQRDE